MYAIGIEAILFMIGLIVNFTLALLYEKYMLYGRFRKTVIVLRVIAVIVLASVILAPVILLNFSETKFLYPVKRFCYSYGVYSSFDNSILPSFLPKKCDDYMFITQGCFPAQDYHPSAYLIFHTDAETLKEYEDYFSSLDNAELQITQMPDKDKYTDSDGILRKCPSALPLHVFGRLEPEHIHNFENAIIYTVHSYYGKGCMLDYDSGLAVFWY